MLTKLWNFILTSAENTSKVRAARVLANLGYHDEARRILLNEK